MGGKKNLKWFQSEFVFSPLLPSLQKNEPIQIGVTKTEEGKRSLCIRISAKVSHSQLVKFLNTYFWNQFDELTEWLKLPNSPSKKRGRKQRVPADYVYFLHTKLGFKPKQIDKILENLSKRFPEDEDKDGVVNVVSIARAIERQKKRRLQAFRKLQTLIGQTNSSKT